MNNNKAFEKWWIKVVLNPYSINASFVNIEESIKFFTQKAWHAACEWKNKIIEKIVEHDEYCPNKNMIKTCSQDDSKGMDKKICITCFEKWAEKEIERE